MAETDCHYQNYRRSVSMICGPWLVGTVTSSATQVYQQLRGPGSKAMFLLSSCMFCSALNLTQTPLRPSCQIPRFHSDILSRSVGSLNRMLLLPTLIVKRRIQYYTNNPLYSNCSRKEVSCITMLRFTLTYLAPACHCHTEQECINLNHPRCPLLCLVLTYM